MEAHTDIADEARPSTHNGFQYNSGSRRKGESNACSGTYHLCKAQGTSRILSCLIELSDIDPQSQATSNKNTLLYGCKMKYM